MPVLPNRPFLQVTGLFLSFRNYHSEGCHSGGGGGTRAVAPGALRKIFEGFNKDDLFSIPPSLQGLGCAGRALPIRRC